MELFINQGKDSTVEPGYLAEMGSKNGTTPAPSETFEVGFTINLPEMGRPEVTSATKTYAELMAALNSGKNLVPVFDFTYPEGMVISSVIAGNGFINNSGNIAVECKITAEVSETVVDVYLLVIWNNPESFTDEFFVSLYNNQK